MQIKEFKEKEVDVKDKSLSNKVYFAVGGIVLAVILIVAVFIKVNEFDIRDYIKPVYTGADGYASVTFVVDEDALSNKLLGKKADDDKKYYVRKFIESINVYTTDTDIKNGDKVHCEIKFNDTYADNAGVDINKKQYTYTAKGINEGAKIDIYSGVDVTFSGISPDARVIIDNDWDDDYLKTLTFTADKASSIKLNDSIKVSCDVSYEDMARHGILAKACEMTYTADKLAAYCDDYTKVNKDVMADIYKEIKETITKETEDATYRMLYVATGNTDYLYHLNEENVSDVNIDAAYFLKALAAGQEADNYIIVQASAVVSDNESSEPVSYVFRYANAYITVDGDFNVGHDNQNKRFICGTDRGVLYEEYIGALSDNYSIDRIDNN